MELKGLNCFSYILHSLHLKQKPFEDRSISPGLKTLLGFSHDRVCLSLFGLCPLAL
jgi:hypothetical protein